MPQSNPTPGPWIITIRPKTPALDSTVAEIEASGDGPYRGMIARLQSAEHINGIPAAEMIANARLIAAAPDLLAALGPLIVIALDNLDGMNAETREECERDIATARAAIAKVRGQS